MSFSTGLFVVLTLAYVARIVGAFLHDEERQVDPTRKPRTRAREVADAFIWPITMFTSKAKRGMDLSALRVMAISAEYFVLINIDWAGEWNGWKVAALLGPPALLILEPLFGMIPVRELSMAAAAYLGSQVAKRVKKTTSSEETETPILPSPAAPPATAPGVTPSGEYDGPPPGGGG